MSLQHNKLSELLIEHIFSCKLHSKHSFVEAEATRIRSATVIGG